MIDFFNKEFLGSPFLAVMYDRRMELMIVQGSLTSQNSLPVVVPFFPVDWW